MKTARYALAALALMTIIGLDAEAGLFGDKKTADEQR
jgi:hypothetical protein